MADMERTHVILPKKLRAAIDARVGKRNRSAFLARAAEMELKRLQQQEAFRKAAGMWKDKDHPELARLGTVEWLRRFRRGEAGL